MLTCIIKNNAAGSNEFILHAPDHFDLRIQCDRRDAFLDLLKLRFAHMKPDVTLKVFGMPSGGLKDYHVTPNKRGGIEHLPAEEFRIHGEEIKCAQEYERESQAETAKSQGPSTKASKEESKGSSGITSSSSSLMSGGSSGTSIDSEDQSFDF